MTQNRADSFARLRTSDCMDARQDVTLNIPADSPKAGGERSLLAMFAAMAAALGIVYAPTLAWFAERWSHDNYYEHGPFVPFICGYFIWREKDALVRAWQARDEPTNRHSILILLAGLVLHLLGILADVNFVSGFSLPLVLLGMTWYIGGERVGRLLRFPILLLWTAVPIKSLLLETLSFPMQLNAARYAAVIGGLVGLQVDRAGVNLYTPTYSFVVAEPCSGLKTMITLLTLALVIANLTPRLSRTGKWAICLVSIPVALIANTMRVFTILMIGVHLGEKAAEGFLHGFSGIFMLVLSLILLTSLSAFVAASWPEDESLDGSQRGDEESRVPPAPSSFFMLRRTGWLIGSLGLLLIAKVGVTRLTASVSKPVRSILLPERIGDWKGKPQEVAPTIKEILRPDAIIEKSYALTRKIPGVAVKPSVSVMAVYSREWRSVHSPKYCLTGAGWSIVKEEQRTITDGNRSMSVNVVTAHQRGQTMQLLYFFVGAGEQMTGWIHALAKLTIAKVRRQDSGAGQVQISYNPYLLESNKELSGELKRLVFSVADAVGRSTGIKSKE